MDPSSSVFSVFRRRQKASLSPSDSPPFAPASAPQPPSAPTSAPPPPAPSHSSRHSIASSVGDVVPLRRSRSSSLRSIGSSHHHSHSHNHNHHNHHHHRRHASSASTMHSLHSPEVPPAAPLAASRPTLSIATFARAKAKSSDNVKPDGLTLALGPDKPKTPFPADKPKTPFAQPPLMAAPPLAPGPNPHIIFQHIHELASKRISTLDYLRKAHEGRIYWFNTLLFSKPDLARLPSSSPRAQSRRATQYLLLGFSLPPLLDMHAGSPADYLRALNALLLEFEQYQTMHPTDGSAPSLSRARIPHMFKRANLAGKARRSSSATGDFPLLTPQSSDSSLLAAMLDQNTTDDLSPGESYLYLQTPSLPFDPDFFSTFATLCDVLIDCYTKILSMLATPESVALAGQGVPATVGDLFSKADARVRKIILAGVVREFEESCRVGVRGEVGGVGKVVLGGLM